MSADKSSPSPFSIERLYTPLDAAVAELHRRRADAELCRKVREFQKQHPPHFLDDRPRAIISRPIFSADLEFERFIQLASRAQLDPLCLELSKDRFVSQNPEKHRRGKMFFRFPKRNRTLRVIDFSCDGQRISDIHTLTGESLVEFHHRLFAHLHATHVNAVLDVSDWYLDAGQIKPGYVHQLALSIIDGILFENFFTNNDDERRFYEERVLPSMEHLVHLFGVKPLIVRLFEPHEEMERWIWQYPRDIYLLAYVWAQSNGQGSIAAFQHSWLHPKLLVISNPVRKGKCIIAGEHIPSRTTLCIFGGRVMHVEDEPVFPNGRSGLALQIHDRFVLGARFVGEIESADAFNHSCDPNAGFVGQIFLVAIRDIAQCEEVCFDYAMNLCALDYRFECGCGSSNCRGVITGEDWKNPELQERYAGYFQPYLQEKINAMRSGG